MRISACAVSHPGNCREKNEDNFCFNGRMLRSNATLWPLRLNAGTKQPLLLGVFDGMGGIKAGERASCIAAQTACAALQGLTKGTAFDAFLTGICMQANAITCNEMVHVIKQRMGTTASMLLFSDEEYHLCNIGDSPIFLFREGKLQPIFHEHTEKENFLRLHGVNALPPKKKFKLTQNIGIFPQEMEIEPYVSSGSLKSGDRFLISSDGLTDMVCEETITAVLGSSASAVNATKTLLQHALNNGGKDNTTIICIDIK